MHAAEHAADAPAQKDNLFGVCAAIGEDLGFNPNWLRVALGVGILWNPVVIAAVYGMMAAVVLATRLVFPDRKAAVAEVAQITAPEAANAVEVEFARAA